MSSEDARDKDGMLYVRYFADAYKDKYSLIVFVW
jgi:hypothetical protein